MQRLRAGASGTADVVLAPQGRMRHHEALPGVSP